MVLIRSITLLDFLKTYFAMNDALCRWVVRQGRQWTRYTVDTWSLGSEAADEWTRGTRQQPGNTQPLGCVLQWTGGLQHVMILVSSEDV